MKKLAQPNAWFRMPYIWFILPAAAIFLTSCERVIEVELNEGEKKVVIESTLRLTDDTLNVSISTTGPYFDSQPTERVSGATVTLSDHTGMKKSLQEKAPGLLLRTRIARNKYKIYPRCERRWLQLSSQHANARSDRYRHSHHGV